MERIAMFNGSLAGSKYFRTPKIASVLLIAGLAATLTGCASGQTKKDAKGAEPAPMQTTSADLGITVNFADWKKLGYQLDWVGFPFPGERRNVRVTQFEAYDDVVVVQANDSTVTVLETSTGKRRWGSELTGPLTRYVGIDRDPVDPSRLYVISESELFVLAVPNGNLVGRQRFERVVNTPPVIFGETLIFGTTTADVYAHGSTLGNRAWGFISDASFEGAPTVVAETVAIVSQKGDVLFLTPNGKLVARHRIFGGVGTNPVSNGSMLFVAGLDQSLWAFDPYSGSNWRFRTSAPLTVQPTAAGDHVSCEVAGDGLVAFEAASGAVQWKNKDVRGTVVCQRDGKLIVWNDGEIFQVDPANGDTIARVKTPGIAKIWSTAFVDGTLYAASDKGVIAKFSGM